MKIDKWLIWIIKEQYIHTLSIIFGVDCLDVIWEKQQFEYYKSVVIQKDFKVKYKFLKNAYLI